MKSIQKSQMLQVRLTNTHSCRNSVKPPTPTAIVKARIALFLQLHPGSLANPIKRKITKPVNRNRCARLSGASKSGNPSIRGIYCPGSPVRRRIKAPQAMAGQCRCSPAFRAIQRAYASTTSLYCAGESSSASLDSSAIFTLTIQPSP